MGDLIKCPHCGGMTMPFLEYCLICHAFLSEEFNNKFKRQQNEMIERAKIIMGEDYVNKRIARDPDAEHSFHFQEPYNSMPLDELRRLMAKNKKR